MTVSYIYNIEYPTVMMENPGTYYELYETESRFRKACQQIILLNNQLEQLQVRYDLAKEDDRKSFRYNLRLKMATCEGVRNAYYEYACLKAETIAELRCDLALDSPSLEVEESFEL